MTKETKVGLVIGLLFMVGVVYVLSLFSQPSEFEQQVAEYRAGQSQSTGRDLSRGIPLSAAKKLELPALETTVQKKEVAVVPDLSPVVVQAPVKEVPVVAPPEPVFYIVKEGQTLTDIALKFYNAAGEDELGRIHEANKYKMPNRDMIWPGLKLLIPSFEDNKSVGTKKVLSLGGARTYTVMPGDTLSEISSRKLGTATRWREILRLNSDKLPSEYTPLRVGMVLKLPAASNASQSRLPRGPEDIWQ